MIGHREHMGTQAQPWRIARGSDWAEQCAAEFDAITPATDWLKKHRTELAVGTVVVIVGVAFAVVVAGSGGSALALAPLLVMAEISPGMPPETQLAEACR